MPRVLILCAHRPQRSPSQRYRFEQYLSFLEEHDFTFQWSFLLNEKEDRLFYGPGRPLRKALLLFKTVILRFKDIFRFKRFDIVFIQREASFLGTSFFEKRAARSTSVIFDFDDSIWLTDTSPENKKWEWLKKPAKFFKIVRSARVVVAGNAYLAGKARPFNPDTRIIPTTIDTDVHLPKPELRNKDVLTIGWSGSLSTTKHFDLLIPVLLQLQLRYGDKIRFCLLGDASYKNAQLPVEAKAWSLETEVNALNSFDIGVMPLPDDAWANGKCGLKGLSYMACGVPTVMSAVGVNKDIVVPGENGFLASTPEEWFLYLSQLVENESLRTKLGAKGRITVVEKYSVQANKQAYLALFKNAAHRAH